MKTWWRGWEQVNVQLATMEVFEWLQVEGKLSVDDRLGFGVLRRQAEGYFDVGCLKFN